MTARPLGAMSRAVREDQVLGMSDADQFRRQRGLPIPPQPPTRVIVRQVVEVTFPLGNGVETVFRYARRYYDLDGTFLAEDDPYRDKPIRGTQAS